MHFGFSKRNMIEYLFTQILYFRLKVIIFYYSFYIVQISMNRVMMGFFFILNNDLAEAKDGMNWEEIKKNQIELLADIVTRNNEIFFLDQELDKLPKKVTFDRTHGGKKLLNLNFEKKRFLDCIKVFSCNMQQQMCMILLNYYDKRKEIMPALAMILNRGGYIKLEHGSLKVRL